jgi:hypothetical protein
MRFGNLSGTRDDYSVVVIDAGFQETGDQVVDHIKDVYKTDRIDLLISTHPDSDHAGGIPTVLEKLKVGKIWMHKPWEHTDNIAKLFKKSSITDEQVEKQIIKSLTTVKSIEDIAEKMGIEIEEPFTGKVDQTGKIIVLGPDEDFYKNELIPNFRCTPEPEEPLMEKLIKGIGPSKERKLKEDGFSTLDDLRDHPSYGTSACELLEKMETRDVCALSDWISTRYSASHHLNLLLSSISGSENMLFMDIETLGLMDVPLILIGVAEGNEDGLTINQYLLRDLKEEKAALDGFLSHQNSDNVYVTFNGRSFDVPFIKSRMRFHHLDEKINRQHLDLLHFSRRQWNDQLPNCRLQTLEKYFFGVERCDDVPSSKVPDFYLTYRETGNIGPLVPIIEHNREDVVTLARILSLLHQCSDLGE